jgi:hypothetical protein
MKRGVDVKSKLERAIEHEKKILATYETLREMINSAENPNRNSPDLEMAADMAFDAYLKARRRVQDLLTHASQQEASHSITSSARSRNESESFSPMAFAVLRLTNISNLVGCSTGRSPGFAPLMILSA